jgi:hypothetical protein
VDHVRRMRRGGCGRRIIGRGPCSRTAEPPSAAQRRVLAAQHVTGEEVNHDGACLACEVDRGRVSEGAHEWIVLAWPGGNGLKRAGLDRLISGTRIVESSCVFCASALNEGALVESDVDPIGTRSVEVSLDEGATFLAALTSAATKAVPSPAMSVSVLVSV